MQNVLLGIEGAWAGANIFISSLANVDLLWGFMIGGLTALLIHGFIISEDPRQIPTMLTNSASGSFSKLYSPGIKGEYTVSYSYFRRVAVQVKLFFSFAILIFFLIVFAASIRY